MIHIDMALEITLWLALNRSHNYTTAVLCLNFEIDCRLIILLCLLLCGWVLLAWASPTLLKSTVHWRIYVGHTISRLHKLPVNTSSVNTSSVVEQGRRETSKVDTTIQGCLKPIDAALIENKICPRIHGALEPRLKALNPHGIQSRKCGICVCVTLEGGCIVNLCPFFCVHAFMVYSVCVRAWVCACVRVLDWVLCLQAFLKGNMDILQDWCHDAVCNRFWSCSQELSIYLKTVARHTVYYQLS